MRRAAAVLAGCFVLTLAIGCAPSVTPTIEPDPTGSATTVPATDSAAVPDHLVFAREAHNLIDAAGNEAWPGWAEAVPPIVVTSPEWARLLGDTPGGGQWREVAPCEWEGPPQPDLGPGVRMLGEQHVAVAPPVEDLQQLIDEAVGEGGIRLDASAYVRFVVHEAFHVFQIEAMEAQLPGFGLGGDERELLPELAEADVADGLAEEARALAEGLRAESEDEAIAGARRFLVLRGQRRATLSDDAVALERSLEWAEGLARYADIALTEAATSDYRPTQAFDDLASHASRSEAAEEHLGWLDDLTAIPGTVRDRYYEVGAAQARLLDRLMPGWQPRALPDGEALESLLAIALDRAGAGVAPTLRALEPLTVAVAGTRHRVVIADRPAFWASGLTGVETLGPVDGVLFVFPEPTDVAFTNRGTRMDLDIWFFDSDGLFVDAAVMPACETGRCDSFEAQGAFTYVVEVPAGTTPKPSEGDVLTLAQAVDEVG